MQESFRFELILTPYEMLGINVPVSTNNKQLLIEIKQFCNKHLLKGTIQSKFILTKSKEIKEHQWSMNIMVEPLMTLYLSISMVQHINASAYHLKKDIIAEVRKNYMDYIPRKPKPSTEFIFKIN